MSGIVASLFLVAGLLVLVSALEPLAARVRLPLTVLMAFAGAVVGAIGFVGLNTPFVGLSLGGEGVESVIADTDVLLAVFLPPLLFQAGLTIDVRRMLDDIGPILLMAIVAVVICTGAVGLAISATGIMALLPALLVGAIISTTDPVAVIGLFRDVGAPKRLSILVEGESLLNDAAAIALMVILLEAFVTTAGVSLLAGIWLFALSFAGGALFGFLTALLCTWLIKPLRRMPLAEITLTLALPYLTYLVAERWIEVSGVVAVVVAALTMAARGRTAITPSSWTALRTVWDQIAYIAAALVFLFAASDIPGIIERADADLLLPIVVTVIAAFAARAITVWGLLPALTLLGWAERVSGEYKLVMWWGGLRGAVTLVLAAAVAGTPQLNPGTRIDVAILATCFVVFTLVVNGLSLRPVMRLAGLHRLSKENRVLRDRAIALTADAVAERLALTAEVHRLDESALREVLDRYQRRREVAQQSAEVGVLDPEQQVRVGLVTLAAREETLYLDHFVRGSISRSTAVAMIAKAGRLRDGARSRGLEGYRDASRDTGRFRFSLSLAMRLHRAFRWEGPLASKLADRFEQLTITRIVVSQLITFTRAKLVPLMGLPATIPLRETLEARLADIEAALESLRLQYPDYAELLAHRFLLRAGLRMEEREYAELAEEAAIPAEVHHQLEAELDRRWREVEERPNLDLGLDTEELVRRFPLFEALAEPDIREISRLLRPRLTVPGERIITRGERGDFMAFISSGAVEVSRDDHRYRLGRGDFFGEIAILTGRRRQAHVDAIAYSQLLILQGRDFRRFAKTHPEARQKIREAAGERLEATSGREA
ncbi:MAG: cation:proton antiporter [Azospirillaceae bacterium]